MDKAEQKLKSILNEFFRDNFYKDGIIGLRESLTNKNNYRDYWEDIIRLIINRNMDKNTPFKLLSDAANIPLDENTDEEAYKWLLLMVINSLGNKDFKIIEY